MSVGEQGERLEMVGRFTAGVAHDFNNLLAAMLSAADAIAARPEVDEQTRADAAQVASAARRGAALVRHMLAFARDDPPAPRRLEVRAALEDLLGLLRHVAGRAIRVTLEPGVESLEALIDATRLDQVLLNLVANARDAMPEGGAIALACGAVEREGARWVAIEVRDSGPGIPPEVLPRIFEPFFTTRENHGNGLGLATVHEIVQAAGGRLEVETAPGAGTRMRVLLPRLAALPVADSRGPGAGPLLLVEDDALTRRLAMRVLAGRGWRVMEAGSADEATALAHGTAPGAVVADMELPDGNGAALVAALRRECGQAALPAVIASGHAPGVLRRDPEVAALLAAAPGITGLLTKPYGAAELGALLAEVTGPRALGG